MENHDSILDALTAPPVKNPLYKWLRRIAIAIEVMLWALSAVALLFKYESWEGSHELLILSFFMLGSFYFCFTVLVTGAGGWKRICGAAGVGISLCLLLTGGMFVLESWEGGREMLMLGRVLAGIAAVVTMFFLIKAVRDRKSAGFYWNVLARLVVVLLIAG